jgi:hypothetical protein
MATMVPRHIDLSVVASERRVFEALRNAAGSQDWTILHSLGMSSGWAGEFGELDFVVVMPGNGIVCVEVKGGGVSVRDGAWTTTNRYGVISTLKKSPYRQVQDNQWKLLATLRKKFGPNSAEARCKVGWIVIFPDVQCPPLTPEATRREIIDRDDLDQDIGARIATVPSLVALSKRTDLLAPLPGTCTRIVSFFRPEFEKVPAPASQDWDIETRLRQLTEEQFEALDRVEDNRVCLLKGPAGTGKTLIGMEAARRDSMLNKSVLVACFNAALGAWLGQSVLQFGPGRVVAGHVHGLLRERIEASEFAAEFRADIAGSKAEDVFGSSYYEFGALAVTGSGERFDTIIVDEVQDIPSARLADLLAAWSKVDGSTRIILLGDFTRQAIYAGSSEASPAEIERHLGAVASFNLRLNCRNTRRIADQTAILSGFKQQKVCSRQPEGEPVSLQYHRNKQDGVAIVDGIIRHLREAGYKPGDLVVIGPRRRENSLLANSPSVGGWTIRPLTLAGADQAAYATAHGFKGLERKVVILIDAAADDADEADALTYVAMSRARLRLFIVAPESARAAFDARLSSAAIAALAVGE